MPVPTNRANGQVIEATDINAIAALANANETAVAARALDNAVVKLTGAQTIAGAKAFTSAPTVPDGSFAIADTSGLQAALDAKSGTSHTHTLDGLSDVNLQAAPPESGDVLGYDGTNWVPVIGGGGGTTNAADITSGVLNIERATPGSEFVVDYYKAGIWPGKSANAWTATRPSARTDISFVWRGPTDPGVRMIGGDVWDQVG